MRHISYSAARCAAVALLLAVATAAMADVPRVIHYQGKVTDKFGNPLAGPVDLQIRLTTGPVLGVVLFSETQNGVPLTNGVFSILIGSKTPGGVPDSALHPNTPYLAVVVNGQDELQPRVQLGMVPFSAKASSAEQLVLPDTFSAAARMDANGSLVFMPGASPVILAGQDNIAARRMWMSHSAGSPNWGIQYRDLDSDGLFADSLEFVAGNQSRPTMSFDLQDGNMRILDSGGNVAFDLRANGSASAPALFMSQDGGPVTVDLRASESTGQGAQLLLRDDAGSLTVEIDADFTSAGARAVFVGTGDAVLASAASGVMQLGSSTSGNMLMDGNEIMARSNGAASTLHLNAEGGTVAIGMFGISPPTDYTLAVDGKVICEEIEVQMSEDWPDYVFGEQYRLMPLGELEDSIRRNRHLPRVPSAADVKSGGVGMGKMQMRLLEKVEELTLYVIQMNKDLEAARSENQRLQERLLALEAKGQ